MDEIRKAATLMEKARTKRDAAIVKAYEAGVPVAEIAQVASLSVRGVYALLARMLEEG